jgi:hypothetical protein
MAGAIAADGPRPLRIGQFTGWHGDRRDGMAELISSGVHVLTGDYLAELTMLVLEKNRQRGGLGYVEAFADLVGVHLDKIAEQGLKVVTNAGGLDSLGLAEAIRGLCAARGIDLAVAAIVGDDMRDVLRSQPPFDLINLDTGEALDLAQHRVLTANAYLGAWPIVEALRAGADIVICPRTTDASLVVGAAAWHFGWSAVDHHILAGAVVAGHIIECGAQATGGNYAFFNELGDTSLPGMPIAEVESDGSCVITKSDGSGGLVSIDTVLAQLYYEVGGHHYQNPDVVTDLSTIQLEEVGPNRVRVSGTRGLAPTSTAKLSLTFEGGYRNSMTIGLTGGNLDLKTAWVRRQVHEQIGPADSFAECRWSTIGPANPHGTFEEATAWLVVTVKDRDRAKVSRLNFSARIVEIATSNVPGFYMTTPPQAERLFGIQWPTLIEKHLVTAQVVTGAGEPVDVPWPERTSDAAADEQVKPGEGPMRPSQRVEGPTRRTTLGTIIGTRSGDKAGSANLGAWARNDETFHWLAHFLTVERLRELMPELEGLRTERFVFTNLRGMNFVIYQYLGDGVSACTRIDPQGKGLGEYLGSRLVDIPLAILRDSDDTERPKPGTARRSRIASEHIFPG